MSRIMEAVSDRLEDGNIDEASNTLRAALVASVGSKDLVSNFLHELDRISGTPISDENRSQVVGVLLAMAEQVQIALASAKPPAKASDGGGHDQQAQIFLSYARRSRLQVDALETWMRDRGFAIWFDRLIEGGGRYPSIIDAQIDASKVALVIWCKHAVRSDWVRYEAARAHSQDKLIPLRLKSLPLYEVPAPYPATLNVLEFGDEIALLETLRKRGIFPTA